LRWVLLCMRPGGCCCCCLQSGSLLLQHCDISSSSGVGVCVQGAQVQLQDCSVHDCAAHGVAVYGALEGKCGVKLLLLLHLWLQRCNKTTNNPASYVLAHQPLFADT
jgi:hypothetical protein